MINELVLLLVIYLFFQVTDSFIKPGKLGFMPPFQDQKGILETTHRKKSGFGSNIRCSVFLQPAIRSFKTKLIGEQVLIIQFRFIQPAFQQKVPGVCIKDESQEQNGEQITAQHDNPVDLRCQTDAGNDFQNYSFSANIE
jgi:hypothetical protein